MKKLILKTLSVMSLAAGAVLPLVGAESVSAQEDKVQIQFYYAWTGPIADANEEMARLFNESQDTYEVIPSYQGTYQDVMTAAQAGFAADAAPEVIVAEPSTVGAMSSSGMALDMTQLAEDNGLDTSVFYESLMGNSIIDGSLYSIPYMRSTPVLFMNATILEEAGLDSTGPKSWDELVEYGEALKEQEVTALTMPILNEWYFEAYVGQAGGSIFNEDETAAAFNNDAGLETLNFWRELQSNGYVDFLTGQNASDQSKANFQVGQTAMLTSSNADVSFFIQMAEENGFELTTAPLPENETQAVPTGGANLVILSDTTEEEQTGAIKFLKFASAPENLARIVESTGYAPTRPDVAETEKIKVMLEEYPQYGVSFSQMDYIVTRPLVEEATEAFSAVTDMLIAFLGDTEMSAEDALTDGEAKVNEILN